MTKLDPGQRVNKVISDIIGTPKDTWNNISTSKNESRFIDLINEINDNVNNIYRCGGELAIEKQHSKGKMTARERVKYLIDKGSFFNEIGRFAAYEMYEEYGNISAAGLIVGIGDINNRKCVIVANDATVKAGAYFEVTLKKTLRAQQIAIENNLPIVYLVDSAGVFLPLQDQVFPDEGHFGKIFYNNARMSSIGIPQIACVMGPCVAGGAYLPVMCDKYIIVDGASMFLAGPALVKAAIGQDIDQETLGGATTHSAISGTADYHEPDDISGLERIKKIIDHINFPQEKAFRRSDVLNPQFNQNELDMIFSPINSGQYDVNEILSRIVDNSNLEEYKSTYGKTLVCGTAKIGGISVGIVANQRKIIRTETGEMQMGGVIYSDSAD
ncbi:MAG: methylcrotonoyl-CoA carboxylase, partial [Candidatus Marinimicrobia bacterium]|nr:methylcrotonoyl-CoA carboxylase [Candidatus Neomarinimicrobiota bacterium]